MSIDINFIPALRLADSECAVTGQQRWNVADPTVHDDVLAWHGIDDAWVKNDVWPWLWSGQYGLSHGWSGDAPEFRGWDLTGQGQAIDTDTLNVIANKSADAGTPASVIASPGKPTITVITAPDLVDHEVWHNGTEEQQEWESTVSEEWSQTAGAEWWKSSKFSDALTIGVKVGEADVAEASASNTIAFEVAAGSNHSQSKTRSQGKTTTLKAVVAPGEWVMSAYYGRRGTATARVPVTSILKWSGVTIHTSPFDLDAGGGNRVHVDALRVPPDYLRFAGQYGLHMPVRDQAHGGLDIPAGWLSDSLSEIVDVPPDPTSDQELGAVKRRLTERARH